MILKSRGVLPDAAARVCSAARPEGGRHVSGGCRWQALGKVRTIPFTGSWVALSVECKALSCGLEAFHLTWVRAE